MYIDERKDGWTVGDLLEYLQGVADKSQPIYMSQDEEGNGFARLWGLGPARIVPAAYGWSDDIREVDDKEGVLCWVLWPAA